MNTALVHVSNVMLRDSIYAKNPEPRPSDFDGSMDERIEDWDPDWRFYFLLCIANCQENVACFPVIESICRGLLTMAVRDSAISTQDALLLMRAIESRSLHNPPSKNRTGHFFLDFRLAEVAPADAQAISMAEKFDDMMSFTDYTNADDLILRSEADIHNNEGASK
jgi:hypothetical protein